MSLSEPMYSTNWGDKIKSTVNQPKSNVFGEIGKPEYPEKNLSEQSTEPTYVIQVHESNLGHIGERLTLLPSMQQGGMFFHNYCQ